MREFEKKKFLASTSPGDDRLHSWKEIAVYLGRDIRTVQRWERREGLPVHRHLHDTNATVYAFKSEIDAWRQQRAPEIPETDPANASPPEAAAPKCESPPASLPMVSDVTGRHIWRRPAAWLAALAGSSALILIAVYSAPPHASRRPAVLAYEEGSLIARDTFKRTVWTVAMPRLLSCLHNWPGHVADLDGDGRAEVLAAAEAQAPAHDELPGDYRSGALYCLDAEGKPRWRFGLNDKLLFGKNEFGPVWQINQWEMFDAPGRPVRFAFTAHESIWWPSMFVLLDGRGQVLGKFVNSGWFLALHRLERPSGAMFLAGGISNSHDAGMLAVLDAEKVSGRSPEENGSAFDCSNCPAGRPLRYFLFPRSELNVATGSQRNGAKTLALLDRRITVYTEEIDVKAGQTTGFGQIDAVYEFSSELELVRASFDDRYWDLHRNLESAGTLKHSRAECPDRNGPRLVRSWDPQNGWKDLHPGGAPVAQFSSLGQNN